ncbi:hypothetical protein [Desulfosporosinus fructosivorans]|nr:hypothetical protein [Desulfosporosinus fructosivorans]
MNVWLSFILGSCGICRVVESFKANMQELTRSLEKFTKSMNLTEEFVYNLVVGVSNMEQQAVFFLKYLPMKISLVSIETSILPTYLGSTLRGAVGQDLHCDPLAYYPEYYPPA